MGVNRLFPDPKVPAILLLKQVANFLQNPYIVLLIQIIIKLCIIQKVYLSNIKAAFFFDNPGVLVVNICILPFKKIKKQMLILFIKIMFGTLLQRMNDLLNRPGRCDLEDYFFNIIPQIDSRIVLLIFLIIDVIKSQPKRSVQDFEQNVFRMDIYGKLAVVVIHFDFSFQYGQICTYSV